MTTCFNYFGSFQEKEEDSDSEVTVAAQPKSEPVYSVLEERRQGGLFSSIDSDNEGDDLFSEPKAKPAPTPESKKKVGLIMSECEKTTTLKVTCYFYTYIMFCHCVLEWDLLYNLDVDQMWVILLSTHNNRNCDNTVKSIELLCNLNSKYLQV